MNQMILKKSVFTPYHAATTPTTDTPKGQLLSLASLALLTSSTANPLAAWADEAAASLPAPVEAAAESVQQAAAEAAPSPTWLSYVGE